MLVRCFNVQPFNWRLEEEVPVTLPFRSRFQVFVVLLTWLRTGLRITACLAESCRSNPRMATMKKKSCITTSKYMVESTTWGSVPRGAQ